MLTKILFFIFTFIVILLLYIIFINKNRKVYKESKKQTEIHYIVNRFNLDMRKINYNRLKWTITIVNSFIVAITATVVSSFNSIGLQILVGFVMLMILIFSIYEIIGRILAKKGSKNK